MVDGTKAALRDGSLQPWVSNTEFLDCLQGTQCKGNKLNDCHLQKPALKNLKTMHISQQLDCWNWWSLPGRHNPLILCKASLWHSSVKSAIQIHFNSIGLSCLSILEPRRPQTAKQRFSSTYTPLCVQRPSDQFTLLKQVMISNETYSQMTFTNFSQTSVSAASVDLNRNTQNRIKIQVQEFTEQWKPDKPDDNITNGSWNGEVWLCKGSNRGKWSQKNRGEISGN